jgi:hypothetical protein
MEEKVVCTLLEKGGALMSPWLTRIGSNKESMASPDKLYNLFVIRRSL